MEGIILAFLGPYTKLVLALSLGLVVVMRKSIRKPHIVALLVITVVTFIAFFAFLLWGFTWHDGTKSVMLYQFVLGLMAAVVVGCGSAVGFYFILMSLGLAAPDDVPRKASSGRGR
jgi:hypothetical protein